MVLSFKEVEAKAGPGRPRKAPTKQASTGAGAKPKGKGKGKGRAEEEDPVDTFSDHEADDSAFAPDFDEDDQIEDLVPAPRKPSSARAKRTASSAQAPRLPPPPAADASVSRASAPSAPDDGYTRFYDALRAWRGEVRNDRKSRQACVDGLPARGDRGR
jgi:hypothetical protein